MQSLIHKILQLPSKSVNTVLQVDKPVKISIFFNIVLIIFFHVNWIDFHRNFKTQLLNYYKKNTAGKFDLHFLSQKFLFL